MKLNSSKYVLAIFVLVSGAWSMTSAADLNASNTSMKSPSTEQPPNFKLSTTALINDDKSLFLASDSGKIIGTTKLSPNDTLICVVLPRKTVEAIVEEQKAGKVTMSNNTLLAKSVSQKSNLNDSNSQSTTKINPPAPIESIDLVKNSESVSSTEDKKYALPQTELPRISSADITQTSLNTNVVSTNTINVPTANIDPTLIQNQGDASSNSSPIIKTQQIIAEAQNKAAASTSENSSDLATGINQLIDSSSGLKGEKIN